jgi:hypothetical protein
MLYCEGRIAAGDADLDRLVNFFANEVDKLACGNRLSDWDIPDAAQGFLMLAKDDEPAGEVTNVSGIHIIIWTPRFPIFDIM